MRGHECAGSRLLSGFLPAVHRSAPGRWLTARPRRVGGADGPRLIVLDTITCARGPWRAGFGLRCACVRLGRGASLFSHVSLRKRAASGSGVARAEFLGFAGQRHPTDVVPAPAL
eukprot:7380335-Prymnesium_polylepis.1